MMQAFVAEMSSKRHLRTQREELLRTTSAARALVKRHLSTANRIYFDYNVARAWTNRQDFEQAVATLEAVEKDAPGHDYITHERGILRARLLIQLGRARDAIKLLDSMVQATAADDHMNLAECQDVRIFAFRALGQHERAGQATELRRAHIAAIPEEDRDDGMRLDLIDNMLLASDWERATQLSQTLLARHRATDGWKETAIVGQTLVRLGLAHSIREALTPNLDGPAAKALKEAVRIEATPIQERRRALHKLIELAILCEDVDAASFHHAAYLETTPKSESTDMLALRARLTVLRDASTAELERVASELDEAVANQIQQLSADSDLREGTGHFYFRENLRPLGELVDITLAIAERKGRDDGPALALRRVLDAQQLNSIARTRGAERCTIETVQAEFVRPDCGVLVYLPWERHTHVFVITRHHVDCMKLAPRVRMLMHTRSLARILAEHPEHAAQAHKRVEELTFRSNLARETLLPPELESIVTKWRGLTVVGTDLMSSVPLEALRLISGDLLGEVVPIDNLSSLPLGVQLARDRTRLDAEAPRSQLAVTLLGVTELRPEVASSRGIEPHSFPAERVEPLISHYDRRNSRSMFDAEVTTGSLNDLDLDSTRVTHIFAHGIRDQSRDASTGITLHDGDVWHDDIARKRARGLVILSACSVGRGAQRRGDGELTTSLGGAFVRGGADAVIQSRVDVELHPHIDLMNTFHAELAAGRSPAEAMQIARHQHVTDDTLARFHSAQVRVFGLGQTPLTDPAQTKASSSVTAQRAWLWLLALGAVIAAGIALVARRSVTATR